MQTGISGTTSTRAASPCLIKSGFCETILPFLSSLATIASILAFTLVVWQNSTGEKPTLILDGELKTRI